MRVGLVGCGRLASAGYAPALRAATGAELVAVADPDHRRRSEVLAAAGGLRRGRVMAFPSAEALLDAVEVDAVVLATPAAAHVADAALVAAAGPALLVEKPPAPDLAGARRLAEVAPRAHIGFNRRFDAGARALRDALRTTAGDTLELDLVLHYRRRSWAAHHAADDALLDLGPHLVDWARWLVGAEVREVRAGTVIADRAEVELRLDRGVARLSARSDALHRERASVRSSAGGDLGRHCVGGPVGAVTGRLARGPHPLVASLTGELEALAATVGGAPDPDLATVADGVAVMAVLDAARRSAAAGGRPTPVP